MIQNLIKVHLLCGNNNISGWAEFSALCFGVFCAEFGCWLDLNADITIGSSVRDVGVFDDEFVAAEVQIDRVGLGWSFWDGGSSSFVFSWGSDNASDFWRVFVVDHGQIDCREIDGELMNLLLCINTMTIN